MYVFVKKKSDFCCFFWHTCPFGGGNLVMSLCLLGDEPRVINVYKGIKVEIIGNIK